MVKSVADDADEMKRNRSESAGSGDRLKLLNFEKRCFLLLVGGSTVNEMSMGSL